MQTINHNIFERWPLEDKAVQSIITSPPYYMVRKYSIPDVIIGGDKNCEHDFADYIVGQDGRDDGLTSTNKFNSISNICSKCGAFKGQYGNEPTPSLYIEHTMLWLEEAWRVLKDDGILFLNIDDKYSGSNMGRGVKFSNLGKNTEYYDYSDIQKQLPKDTTFGMKRKTLMLIPEEIMIRMRNRGWIIRGKIVWMRTMPESVKDRFSSQSETIIFATKNPKYYFNLDAVKERIKAITIVRYLRNHNSTKYKKDHALSADNARNFAEKFKERYTKILKDDAETMGSPRARYHRGKYDNNGKKADEMCGGGHYEHGGINAENSIYRQKQTNGDESCLYKNPGNVWLDYYLEGHRELINTLGVDGYIEALRSQILAESDIFPPFIEGLKDEHYAPFSSRLVKRLILCSSRPDDTILDPFVGSGTTVKTAIQLGRKGIGFDIGYDEVRQRILSNIQIGLNF